MSTGLLSDPPVALSASDSLPIVVGLLVFPTQTTGLLMREAQAHAAILTQRMLSAIEPALDSAATAGPSPTGGHNAHQRGPATP
jgi:hypothetical protein